MPKTGNFLLDTNVVIAILDRERKVLQNLRRAAAIFLPTVVVGELYYGAFKSTQARRNLDRVEEFTAASAVVPCDLDTARQYGQIKLRLRRKGKPLPDNDIWIAALAFQHGLTLVSRDGHFGEVDNLSLTAW